MTTLPSGVIPYPENADKAIDYKYYFFLIKKNLFVILTFTIVAVTLASIYAAKIPDLYQSSVQLMIERPKIKWAVEYQGPEVGSYEAEYYNTQMKMMVNDGVLRQVIKDLRLESYYLKKPDQILKILQRTTAAFRIGNSRLFNIQVTGVQPSLVAKIANGLAKSYIRKNFEDQLFYSKEILNWLPQSGDPEETITITNPLGGVTQMTRRDLIESLPGIQGDPTIKELKERLSTAKAESGLQLKRYREKHPLTVKALANIRFLEESIDGEKKRIIDNLKSQAEGRHKVADVRVIQEAHVPEAPLPSKRTKIIVIAGLAAFVMTFGLIILIDHFDDTIHSYEDFDRRGLILPFLGPIPFIRVPNRKDPQQQALASYYDKLSGIAESFRYLRVAINFSAPPEALKKMVITSCLPHEGKSFVSHNTAVSLAQDGNRTLLIDGDMRRPTVDTVFKLDNATGLSSYLTSNLKFESIVRETFIENLFVVTSGPMSPNPGEILASQRMKALLEQAEQQYDRIIIDCPPLTGIGDGFVVGNMIGYLILVVSANKTPSDLIKHTQSAIEKAKIKLIGVVLNKLDMEKERHRGYSKYYYHTYNRYYQISPQEPQKNPPKEKAH